MAIFRHLKNPAYLFLLFGVSILIFDMNYYFMQNLPGSIGNMCVMGANFTPINIGFSIIISLLTGLTFSGIFAIYHARKAQIAVSSLSAIGLFVGTFTVFCTFCTIPIVSLLGLSVSLSFFTEYNLYFKIASLILMFVGLYFLNAQLKNTCKICKR